jgi:D-glycero-D-manno-heptose 1,7-bisphosphate phosphatase
VTPAKALQPAAFLDRDGTIIHDASYIRDPDDATLIDGAADAIRRLNDAGVPVIVVTNQSGIARGLLSEADYAAVEARVADLVRAHGGRIDASYHCPHFPEISGACDCRKPGLKLYRDAAAAHGLDLARSAYIGDRWRDAAPAKPLGGLGIVVLASSTPPEDMGRIIGDDLPTATSLDQAVTRFLATLGGGAS